MLLIMPKIVAGRDEPEWKITGHVIHLQSDESESAKYAVGVEFDCYEISGRCKNAQAPPSNYQGQVNGVKRLASPNNEKSGEKTVI